MNSHAPAAIKSSDNTSSALITDEDFLQDVRQHMLKFASLQLGDANHAEDAVQEALMGAIKNARSFSGRAALKTWIFAILKNKIADMLRQQKRLNETGILVYPDDDLDDLFNAKGFWHKDERPSTWGNPEADMQEKHFWRVFDRCLNHLPAPQARVFMMREFIELNSTEICTAVGITQTHLNVLLYRARLRLRECLENNWFAKGDKHA